MYIHTPSKIPRTRIYLPYLRYVTYPATILGSSHSHLHKYVCYVRYLLGVRYVCMYYVLRSMYILIHSSTKFSRGRLCTVIKCPGGGATTVL
jgi:hypothetical protein